MMLALKQGNLCLTSLNASEVRNQYPGISRVKPATYFGEDLSTTTRRFGLHDPDAQIRWFNRVCSAYQYYWPEKRGRIHCHEPADGTLQHPSALAIGLSLLPGISPAEGAGEGILLGFEIPPVELYRRVTAMPRATGKLRVVETGPESGNVLFHNIEYDALRRAAVHPAYFQHRVDHDCMVWVSAQELSALAPSEFVSYACALAPKVKPSQASTRYAAEPWELLSSSIAAAHLGRLVGDLSLWRQSPSLHGLVLAGALQGLSIARFAPIMERIPKDSQIHWGLGRLAVRVDASAMIPIIEAAYHAQLLPLYSVPGAKLSWRRDNTVFDMLFDLMVTGDFDALHRVDQTALDKGGIPC